MRKETTANIHYLKIGTFILLGLFLLVLAIIVFGSGRFLQKTIYIETYFDESVQGISVGSPVKYRGLQIGYVKDISLANEIYKHAKSFNRSQYNRYIYVGMIITSTFLTSLSKKEIQALLKKDIGEGLRVKLSLQGLTGIAFLELNFVDPKTKNLPIDWVPKNYYIPSAKSVLSQFSDNVQYVFNELKKADIDKLFKNIAELANSGQQVAQKADALLARTNQKIVRMVNNLTGISENLRSLSERAKTFPSQTLFGNPPPPLDPKTL